MKRFKLLVPLNSSDDSLTMEDVMAIVEPYVNTVDELVSATTPDAAFVNLPEMLTAVHCLTNIPGTTFYVLPVEEHEHCCWCGCELVERPREQVVPFVGKQNAAICFDCIKGLQITMEGVCQQKIRKI